MFAKIAVLFHSKVAIAILGGLLVAGTGGVVATAATGQSPVNLIANATHLGNAGSHNDSGDTSKDDQSKIQGKSGQNAHLEGTITSLGSSGFVLSSVHDADDGNENNENEQHDANDDHGNDHGTPTASPSTTTTTPTTVRVTVNEQTKFEGVAKTFGDLKVGMQVEVQGAGQTDGNVLASQVESGGDDAQNTDGQQVNEQEVSGTVLSVGADSFTLKAEQGAKTITVSKTTVFDGGLTGLGDLKVGKQVEVKGTLQSDGSIAATRVHGEDSGSGGSGENSGSGDGGSGGSGSKGN